MRKKIIISSAFVVVLILVFLFFCGKLNFLFSHTYIESVESVVCTIEDTDHNYLGGTLVMYDPPISGNYITIVCRLNPGTSEKQASGLRLSIYPENSLLPVASYTRVAYERCRVGFKGYIPAGIKFQAFQDGIESVENKYVIFHGELPSDLATGKYNFVIRDNLYRVDTVFSYNIVASEQESSIIGDFIPDDIAKPVIYMYPETDTEAYVSLDLDGEFTCTYPSYNDDYGWHVMAHPGGVITDLEAGREYDYLYWEGRGDVPDDFEHAVCVRGCDTATFLEEYLEASGLTYSEIDDFITYWLPKMECNEYNLISFPITEYEELAELHVNPEPDTVIRVYMVFTPLDEEVYIPEEQQLQMPTPVERTGFTVVEWGGSEV